MSHKVRYIGTRKQNEAAALQDCKEYLSNEFNHVVETIRTSVKADQCSMADKYRSIAFILSMYIGIEGYYPVRAMVREVLK